MCMPSPACHTMCIIACICRCASIDGDADRLVYFQQSQPGFALLDGDRIASLLGLLVQHLAQAAGLAQCKVPPCSEHMPLSELRRLIPTVANR